MPRRARRSHKWAWPFPPSWPRAPGSGSAGGHAVSTGHPDHYCCPLRCGHLPGVGELPPAVSSQTLLLSITAPRCSGGASRAGTSPLSAHPRSPRVGGPGIQGGHQLWIFLRGRRRARPLRGRPSWQSSDEPSELVRPAGAEAEPGTQAGETSQTSALGRQPRW